MMVVAMARVVEVEVDPAAVEVAVAGALAAVAAVETRVAGAPAAVAAAEALAAAAKGVALGNLLLLVVARNVQVILQSLSVLMII